MREPDYTEVEIKLGLETQKFTAEQIRDTIIKIMGKKFKIQDFYVRTSKMIRGQAKTESVVVYWDRRPKSMENLKR